ncbi:type III secretion system chaperone [Candidatus Similichlamydia epinepheli]|uniref:type III secretion system chaperone n=1 Tax=Candidatus Similichlamydia epinepheli TaxID=1903953 RepID=UPI0019595D96|nr:type III secretion system chaperone [Candidatus Similichlamydia epinepheli]
MVEFVHHLEWKVHLEDEVSVDLRCVDGRLLFQVSVTNLTRPNTSQLIDILSANCLGLGTLGNVLCLDREGVTLLLIRRESLSVAYREFLDALKDLISATVFWRQRLA